MSKGRKSQLERTIDAVQAELDHNAEQFAAQQRVLNHALEMLKSQRTVKPERKPKAVDAA